MPKHYFYERSARELYVWDGKRTKEGEPEIVLLKRPWGGDDLYTFNGKEVQLGDRFERKAELRDEPKEGETEGKLIRQAGPWQWLRRQGEPHPRERLVPANIDRVVKTAPGKPMRDPEGQPVYGRDPRGKPMRQEQPSKEGVKRNQWTGEEEPEPGGGEGL